MARTYRNTYKYAYKSEYKSMQKYDIEQRSGESDMQYYRRLAKVSDQRLVRLEELSTKTYFKNVLKYSYATAINDIEIFGEGTRFNTKPPSDRRLFNEKIMAMRRFLSAPTSTKAGIIETYQKRADTINKNYGTNFTWQEITDYYNKGIADKLSKEYGSRTALYAIGKILQRKKELLAGIKENKSIKYDGPVTDAALDIIRKTKWAPDSVLGIDKETKKKIRKELKDFS